MEINNAEYSSLNPSSRSNKREQKDDFRSITFPGMPMLGKAIIEPADKDKSLKDSDTFAGPNPPMFMSMTNGLARKFDFQSQPRDKRRQDKEK